MYQSEYFIEKTSNTFADNLAAFGLAFVLDGVAQGRTTVCLEDVGSAFALRCGVDIQGKWVEECQFFMAVPFLATYDRKTQKKVIKGGNVTLSSLPLEGGSVVIDYEAERKSNADFFAWMRQLSEQERRLAARSELRGPAAPHPDWDLFRAVNPAALQAYNSLVAEWWLGQDAFQALLKILLQMTATMPNDVGRAAQEWAQLAQLHGWPKPKEATAAQLLNPAQGKGVNSSKMAWRTPGQMSNFWLVEWLKLVGLKYGGMTRTVRGAKDRKTYVLAPKRLDWANHLDIMLRFRRSMAGSATAVKMDVMVALRYTQALLQHYEEARVEDLEAELFGHSANDLVSGLHTAFYKDMGNAIATMNISSINLPSWVKPDSQKSLGLFQTTLDEHMTIVRSLDESRGEQFELLNLYRDFLSGNDLRPFFGFTTAYSSFIMSRYDRQQFVRPFTTSTLEVLFMNSDDAQKTFSQIVQSEGFRNIAYAIRYSTVVPQGIKARKLKPAVDVRYGLGQQLARKAAYPADFLAEVAEFVQLYNAENAQLREHSRNPYRKNVTTADMDALVELVDRFGAKVVCNLLVAYGYAREPFERSDGGGSDSDYDGTDADLDAAENADDVNADDVEK